MESNFFLLTLNHVCAILFLNLRPPACIMVTRYIYEGQVTWETCSGSRAVLVASWRLLIRVVLVASWRFLIRTVLVASWRLLIVRSGGDGRRNTCTDSLMECWSQESTARAMQCHFKNWVHSIDDTLHNIFDDTLPIAYG